MKFDELLKNKDNIKKTRLSLLDAEIDSLAEFLKTTDDVLNNELLTAITTLIEQLIGHYNQLVLKGEEFTNKNELVTINNKKQEFIEKFTTYKEKKDITSLVSLYKDIKESYKTYQEELQNNVIIEKDVINSLVTKANLNLEKINTLDLDSKLLEELVDMYVKIYNNENKKENLQLLITKTEDILSNISEKEQKPIENKDEISIFTNLDSNIIKGTFRQFDNLIYAIYTLDNKEKYYTIIKEEQEVLELNKQFSNLPNLVLKKDNIIKTCQVIIKNAMIYYSLKEFVRYIEYNYKDKNKESIVEVIANYKNRLTILENILNNQLSFIDEIALLVNKKPSSKYPNVIYNDIPLENYFQNEEKTDLEKESTTLIKDILLNPNVKTTITADAILRTSYQKEILNKLYSLQEVDNTLMVKEEIMEKEGINNPKKMATNIEKITDYLNMRLKEYNLLINSDTINITITEDNDPLCKDINTVLDLHTAMLICDKVYKKGQGLFAIMDYLRTGELTKFTSQYGARNLASSVDRDLYIKLLLENMIKEFTLSGSKANDKVYKEKHINSFNFIGVELGRDNLTINNLITMLLNNEKVVDEAITNFNYEYLNVFSPLSNTFNTSLTKAKEANNLSAIKIDDVLMALKRNYLDTKNSNI